MEPEMMEFNENSPDGWPTGVYTEGGRFYVDTWDEGQTEIFEGDWVIERIERGTYYIVREADVPNSDLIKYVQERT